MKKYLTKSRVLLVLMLLVALFLMGCDKTNVQKELTTTTPTGKYNVTLQVVDDKGERVTYNINTNAKLLFDAIKTTDGLTLDGEVGDYGYYITAVNGIAADYDKDQAYWAFYVNGEYAQTSIDTQPISDGDAFRLVYEKAKSE